MPRDSERGFSFSELLARAAETASAICLWLVDALLWAVVALRNTRRRARGIPATAFVPSRATRPHVPPVQIHRPASQRPEGSRLGMNPYQVLRVQRSATMKEIDDAYCLMRKLSFYGTVKDPLPIIDLAHDLLMDPESRREVDEALRRGEFPAVRSARRHVAPAMKQTGP